MKDRATGEKHPMTKPIHLGQYCWIGNRSTLMPGTVLPDRIIVASNSLLNKNYVVRGVQPYSILGGMPAAVIKEGVERIYKNES